MVAKEHPRPISSYLIHHGDDGGNSLGKGTTLLLSLGRVGLVSEKLAEGIHRGLIAERAIALNRSGEHQTVDLRVGIQQFAGRTGQGTQHPRLSLGLHTIFPFGKGTFVAPGGDHFGVNGLLFLGGDKEDVAGGMAEILHPISHHSAVNVLFLGRGRVARLGLFLGIPRGGGADQLGVGGEG